MRVTSPGDHEMQQPSGRGRGTPDRSERDHEMEQHRP
jgi:hypothetical protein